VRISEIARRVGTLGERRLKLCAIVVAVRNLTSKKGLPMAFFAVSDPSGQAEVTVFSEVLATSRDLIQPGRPLLVAVDAQVDGEGFRLTAQKMQDLDRVAAATSVGLKIVVDRPDPLANLREAIKAGGTGGGKVRLVLRLPGDREAELRLPGSWALSADVRARLRNQAGVLDVAEV